LTFSTSWRNSFTCSLVTLRSSRFNPNHHISPGLEFPEGLEDIVDHHIPLVFTDDLHDFLGNLEDQLDNLGLGSFDDFLALFRDLFEDDMDPSH